MRKQDLRYQPFKLYPSTAESHFHLACTVSFVWVSEEEHDVVWFHLKKDAGHECTVCGQVFQVRERCLVMFSILCSEG